MAIQAKAGSFSTGTGVASSTVNVTVGFQPVAIIFWWSGRTDTTDANGAGSHQRGVGFGVSDTDRALVCSESTNALGSAQTDHRVDAANCIAVLSNAATTAVAGAAGLSALASWPSDGFQLTISTAFTASLRVHYLAIGGADLTNAHTGSFSNPTVTNATYDTTTVGFQPDAIFFAGIGSSTAPPVTGVDSGMFLGFAISSTGQGILLGGSNDASATTASRSYCTDAECIGGLQGSQTAFDNRAQFVSFLSNGFRLNYVAAASAHKIIYLALKGGLYAAGSFTTQTDTTTTIVASGFGFSPAGVLIGSHCKAKSTTGTLQNTDDWSIGGFSSTTSKVSHGITDVNGHAGSQVSTAVEHSACYVNIDATGAIEGMMDVQSIDSGGFTLIMSDADPSASFAWYLAFGSASTGNSYSQTATDAPTLSESISRLGGFNRTNTDTLTASESVVRGLNLFRSAVDGPNTIDSPSRTLTEVRSVIDAPHLSESITRVSNNTRAIPDSTVISESINRVSNNSRSVTDVPTLSESATDSKVKLATTVDNITLSEVSTRSLLESRSLIDTPLLSESIISTKSKLVNISDAPHTTELVTRTLNEVRSITDSLLVSESLVKISGFTRSISETITTSMTSVRVVNESRTTIDTPLLGESLARILGSNRATTDTYTLTDLVSGIKGRVVTTTDHSTLSESLNRSSTITRPVVTSIVTSELVSKSASHPRTTTDITTLSELISKFSTLPRVTIDHPALSESLTRLISTIRVTTDNLAILDIVNRTTTESRSISEVLTIPTVVSKFTTLPRTTIDHPSLSESLSNYNIVIRSISDVVSFSEVTLRGGVFSRVIVDNFSISEVVFIILVVPSTTIPPIKVFTLDFDYLREFTLDFTIRVR